MKNLCKIIGITLIAVVCAVVLGACESHEHSFGSGEKIKNPTCGEQGIFRKYCECGEYADEFIPVLPDHSFGEWTVVTEKTCTQNGKNGRYCSVCGYAEEQAVQADHDYEEKWAFDTSAHWKEMLCEHRGEHKAKFGYHTLSDWEVTKEAVCDEAGQKSRSCDCGYTETEQIPAPGHAFEDSLSFDAGGHYYKATCEHKGEKKDYAEHSLSDWSVVTNKTCDADGEKTRSCSCGYVLSEVIPASHDFGEEVGYDEGGHYYLPVCEHKDEKKDYTAHEYSEWETVTEASCTEKGEKSRSCECGYVDKEITPETGHTYSDKWSYDASGHYKLAVCEHKGERGFEGEHSFGEWSEYRAATCTESGEEFRVCQCGKKDFRDTEPKGHEFEESWSYDYSGHYYVAKCGHVVENENANHVFVDGKCTVCERGVPSETKTGLSLVNSSVYLGETDETEIIIPSRINGSTVSKVGYEGFKSSKVKCVVLPDSVTELSYGAFYTCTELTSVYFGKGITKICDDAFIGCTSLTRVYIDDIKTWMNIVFESETANPLWLGADLYVGGELVTEVNVNWNKNKINDYCFMGYDKLTKVTLGQSVRWLDSHAFAYCENLSEINLSGLNEFGNGSLAGTAIEEIKLGKNVTYIGSDAFAYCNDLTSVELNLTSSLTFESHAFSYCPNLTDVKIGDQVTTIPNATFVNCTRLEKIVIGPAVTFIGDMAFGGCYALKSVTLGKAVKTIEYEAFLNCPRLYEVINLSKLVLTAGKVTNGYVSYCAKHIYTEQKTDDLTNGDFVFNKMTVNGVEGNYLVGYVGSSDTVTLPTDYNGEKYSLYGYIFSGNDKIKSVTVPEGVTALPEGLFYNCTGLESVTLPTSLKTIGDKAFFNCAKLREISLPDGLEKIGSYAFYTCGSLKEIFFPETLKEIGSVAFYYTGLTELFIPDSVTTIGQSAFWQCEALERVVIGEGLKNIPSFCFNGCLKLKDVTFGSNIVEIGYMAFAFCVSIETLDIPDSVIDLGYECFAGCIGIKYVYLGTGLKSTYCSFYSSTDGRVEPLEVHIKDLAKYLAIEFENTDGEVLDTHTKLFLNGKLIEGELVIPDGVTRIGEQTFNNYSYITSVVIPDSVTEIGQSAFASCLNLRSVVIGKKVRKIENFAFLMCYKLVHVVNLSSLNIKPGDSYYTNGGAGEHAPIIRKENTAENLFVTTEDGFVFYKNTAYYQPVLVGYEGDAENLVFPELFEGSKYKIAGWVFYANDKIKSVTINGGVTDIGYCAFAECSKLESVYLKGVTTVGERAFYMNSNLKTAYVLRVSNMGSMAFSGNSADVYCSDLQKPAASGTYGWQNGWISSSANVTWGYVEPSIE